MRVHFQMGIWDSHLCDSVRHRFGVIDWDDYNLLLHVARRGRVADAAHDLRVTASTVFRRIASIEAKLGRPVFVRHGGTYVPTEDGAAIIRAAERMEQETAGVARQFYGVDQSLSGSVTVTTTEVLSSFFVARHVAGLVQKHPKLSLRVISSDGLLDLSRHEADVAIRPKAATSNALFGRRLATVRWARYVSLETDPLTVPEDQPAIGFAGDPRRAELLGQRTEDVNRSEAPMLNGSSKILQAAMCANTNAVAVLPMILGEAWPGLHRVGDVLDAPVGEFWIVCHTDMRRNPRVRAVFDAMIEGARADRHLFEGA